MKCVVCVYHLLVFSVAHYLLISKYLCQWIVAQLILILRSVFKYVLYILRIYSDKTKLEKEERICRRLKHPNIGKV